MVHTTTLVADHKGMTVPKAVGDEFVVNANINITTYTEDGEIITAASLGLSSIHAVLITGQETDSNLALQRFVVELSATGAYESATSFALVGMVASTGVESANGDLGIIRVRVYGNL